MVDRILHIRHKFSKEYESALLERAAEVAVYKGPAAVAPHLTAREKMTPDDAALLAQKINSELRHVNRQVLLQYAIFTSIFIGLVVAALFSQSYIFAGVLALPALRFLYALLKFIRRNRF